MKFVLSILTIISTIVTSEGLPAISDMEDLCIAVTEAEAAGDCVKRQDDDGCYIQCANGSVNCSMQYGSCWFNMNGKRGSISIGSYPAVCGLPI